MNLPALWGGAWQQRAEVQRSWAAYYAGGRHIGRRKPCCLIDPRAACESISAVGAASFALGGVASACTPDGSATYVLLSVSMLLMVSASTWRTRALRSILLWRCDHHELILAAA